MVNTASNTFSFDITENVVQETAAHIHGFAGQGVNAGILFGLPAGAHKVGTWNYPESSEANILSGLTYINVHSVIFPGGEIRGQVEPPLEGTVGVPSETGPSTPALLLKLQPNPFASTTDIGYTLATRSNVRLTLYDASGHQVRVLHDGTQDPGEHHVSWDGSNDQGVKVAAAVYFARLQVGVEARVGRLVLLR